MLGSVNEFFRNLPAKVCNECGSDIEEEMADCYQNECDDCQEEYH
ncbi:protein YhfH [Texcoconibacillus texcoconensis]|uniref:YhfH family protein n=1 Tax=Texcoconibacillus texcoconensis TaxID=1095777 RepID=A0A840QT63_9BACI|nr:protein YhfH [Texcoconibacillus texcoconensis]MBB5174498.1 hypothetical protein [Texcoconibacillus texcoconensis]